ncbi:MAG: anaerobic ribonucleoside-triphosphate reductase activating protein [Patescibacteria group bacterium]|nr:anaerobic ribonucleoside-triphosphate reductase activating protein [Patescibacteria group bacterium]
MRIGGLQKLTLIDYPGHLAATVFLIGCNFRCGFCYSSELVLPEKIKIQPEISKKDFFSFLKSRKELLEGIVVCGGEPTINSNLPSFIKKIKKLGFLVKLDTNGSNPKMLKTLINKKLIDYIAMDIKAPKQKYIQIINASGILKSNIVKNIEKSIDILKKSNIDYEFRTTIVPSLHGKKDILGIVDWIKPAKKYYLQNFKGEKTIDPGFEKLRPYSREYLLEIQQAVSPFFDVCQVR